MPSAVLLSEKWHKKSRKPFKDFLLGGAAGGRLIFSFTFSGQISLIIGSLEKFSAYIIPFIERIKRTQVTIINAARISKPVCLLRGSFADVVT